MSNRMNDYSDIIGLPHHTSKRHPRMSMANRAAQFAPFAALSGHDDAINETARLTDKQITLDEDVYMSLDRKLAELRQLFSGNSPVDVTITFFKPDRRKDGGSYKTITATLKRIDDDRHMIHLIDGTMIDVGNIIDLDFER